MRKLTVALTISTLVAGGISGCGMLGPKAAPPAPAAVKPAVDNVAKAAPAKPTASGRRGSMNGMLEGVLIGGVPGRYEDEEAKDLAQTVRDYGYTAAQGPVVAFDFVRANPAVIPAGETVNVNTEYAVLLPAPEQLVTVVETRAFSKDGVPAGKVSIEVERVGGSYKSTIPFTIPASAAPGNYQVTVTIEAQGGAVKDTKETFFKVTR
jgi:hypothetical protein